MAHNDMFLPHRSCPDKSSRGFSREILPLSLKPGIIRADMTDEWEEDYLRSVLQE
jgi:hypothetical protein